MQVRYSCEEEKGLELSEGTEQSSIGVYGPEFTEETKSEAT